MSVERRKGVSPLIAVVLLIAFTLAIGGFMSTWLQDLTRTQAEDASERASAGCVYATINADNVVFNTSGEEYLKLTITNAGTKNVYIDKIRVTGEDSNMTILNSTQMPASGLLFSGDEVRYSFNLSGRGIANISYVRIIPTDCPQSAITIGGDEIS